MRPPKPLKREAFDKAVTAMFRAGDSDRDGTITIAELRATIDARRQEVVEARFKRIDSDGNGAISRGEFLAWQSQLGTAASSEEQSIPRESLIIPAVIEPPLDDDPDDMAMRRLIEPLSATVLVKANSNYDAGVTLGELLAYEGRRFDEADSNHDGSISMDEARPTGPEFRPRPDGGPGGPGGPPPGRGPN